MKELGLKAQVFIDILKQVPLNSNKTTYKCFVEGNHDKFTEQQAIDSVKERCGFDPSEKDINKWMITSERSVLASREVDEARKWLVDNGYLFQYKAKNYGGLVYTNTGVTKKGWKVAPKYLKLIEGGK